MRWSKTSCAVFPGIEVDTDGTITAQGEEVQNVLVEGKEFFGRDPRIATRNLPADAVKQVDVYDKQSDMAEFTGIPDGEDERTIDLRLREEARVGYFGRATGGFGGDVNNAGRLGPTVGSDPVGNDLRYDGRFNLNRFTPTQQVALTANTNNVNQEGFSWDDGGGRGGGDDGFTESVALGLNGSRDFGRDNTWLRGSYFLSEVDNEQNRTLQQQGLFGANVASLVDETTDQESGNNNHRVNLNGQYTFSPGHQLRIRANMNAGSSSSESFRDRVTQTDDGQPLNTASTTNLVNGDQQRGEVQITWRKRLGDSGRSLVAELRGGLPQIDSVALRSTCVALAIMSPPF